MDPNKKVLLAFVSFILVVVSIACSCGSLSSVTPSGSVATSAPVNGNATSNANPSMAGKWEDKVFNNIHTIVWQNNSYLVVSTIHQSDSASYQITSQDWSNGVLTWIYSVPGGSKETISTVSLTPDSNILSIAWSNTEGNAGTMILYRVH